MYIPEKPAPTTTASKSSACESAEVASMVRNLVLTASCRRRHGGGGNRRGQRMERWRANRRSAASNYCSGAMGSRPEETAGVMAHVDRDEVVELTAALVRID